MWIQYITTHILSSMGQIDKNKKKKYYKKNSKHIKKKKWKYWKNKIRKNIEKSIKILYTAVIE